MLAVVATIAMVGGGTYAYMEYSRGVAGVENMPVSETLTAEHLLQAFQADEQAATEKYVGTTDQAVQVSGTIRSMEPQEGNRLNLVLETGDALAGVICEFAADDVPSTWRPGAQVTIRGICTGLLMDVVLVRCKAVQPANGKTPAL